MRAVFLDYATVSNSDLNTDRLMATMPSLELFDSTDAGQIATRLVGSKIVLVNKVALTRAHMESAPDMGMIAVAATGTDNIDLIAAKERKIAVCNVRGYCTQSVTQQVWALILDLTQHVHDYNRLAKSGSWSKSGAFSIIARHIRELAGLTFGVVGWGELDQAAACWPHRTSCRYIVR